MKNLKGIIVVTLAFMSNIIIAQNVKSVSDFNKVIISPHIETTFVQGDENSVTILENKIADDKVNIIVKRNTLRVYLDNAKENTKVKIVTKNGVKTKVPFYNGKILSIKVTYINIDELSLRGEQRTVCESPINVKDFELSIYGESQVIFNQVDFQELDADIYGESQLTIAKGKIGHQKITAYGEAEIDVVGVNNKTAKLKALGEAVFKVNTANHIKFTAFGEAELYYKGNPEIDRGFGIGASTINQI